MESETTSTAPFVAGKPIRRVWSQFRELLPREEGVPFTYTPALIAYVISVSFAAAGAAALTVPANIPHGYGEALAAGGVATFVLSAMSVDTLSGVSTFWSASAITHIGLSLSLGPLGGLVASVGEAVGTNVRYRLGAFRTVFNLADFFLTNLSCWAVFTLMTRVGPPDGWTVIAASVMVGITHWLVNHLPIVGVLRLAVGKGFDISQFVRRSIAVLPYSIGYGYGGYVFVLVRDRGALGITSAIAPAALLQGFLILLSRRTNEYQAAQTEAARIEKELLERAVDASEQERQRIAGELHDGVVQDLVGMSLTMSAAGRVTRGMSAREHRLADLLRSSADVTRAATGDLRTLMIEIAPPSLADAGLPSVMEELVSKAERVGIRPDLTISKDIGLSERDSKLIYRVAQEGVRNAIKYSKATTLIVTVERSPGEAVLTVKDDGLGFTPEQREQRRQAGHMGLGLLAQTAKDGGGTLAITSEPGAGTTLTLHLPLAGGDNSAAPGE